MIDRLGCECCFNFDRFPSLFNVIRSRFLYRERPLVVVADSVFETKKRIKLLNPKMICLNNISHGEAPKMVEYLNIRFPEPAPWEL